MNASNERSLERITQQLIRWRLSAPAIAFLHAHKPLSFIGAQLLLILQPFLGILLPDRWIDKGVTLLIDRKQWDTLLCMLESAQKGSAIADRQSYDCRW